MKVNYKYVTEQLYEKAINYRREFHAYPEQAFCEYRTSARIADVLKAFGYEVYIGKDVCKSSSRMGVPDDETLELCEKRAETEGADAECIKAMKGGQTGVVGILKGKSTGKVTALRFDIDALPITEANNIEYKSLHEGTMHACGHDGHISAGLILAEIIANNRKNINGEIRLIFQPAEEGARGAKAIVDNGWLDGVDEFLSGHIGLSCTKLGEIGACSGGFLATTKFNITFNGVASHAAKSPEKGKNALLAAATFTVNAYAIPNTSEGITRMNVGKLISGNSRNIIADKAFLEMETRGENDAANQYMERSIERVAKAAAEMFDVSYEIDRVGFSETASSDKVLVSNLKSIAENMGLEKTYYENMELGASEDAAIIMNYVKKNGGQAAYYMFGSELSSAHHQNNFNFNEEVLRIMPEFYARAVLG